MRRKVWLSVASVLAITALTWAKDPLLSGPKVGTAPVAPYRFWVSNGASRGQETCFICETADRPAVVVFARNPSDRLGKLAGKLDKALAEHKAAELRSWLTFVGKDFETTDRQLQDWSTQHGLKSLTVGTFKDEDGPPSYLVAREADVTVVLFVARKVQATFAFRAGELTDEAVNQVLEAVPRLFAKDPVKSGPQVGEKVPGPFEPLNVNGRSAGKKNCLYCDNGTNPVVAIFARDLSEPLTGLIEKIEGATSKHTDAKLGSFVVFCSDATDLPDKLKSVAEKASLKHTVLAIDKPAGPDRYQIAKDADLTVVLYVDLEVKANHTFKKGQFKESDTDKILSDFSKILPKK
jgi:hypothetical protein